MAMNVQELQQELLNLSPQQQLHLARWLINHAVDTLDATGEQPAPSNGLAALVGLISGGPGDSAERAEEILEAEVQANSGLSDGSPT